MIVRRARGVHRDKVLHVWGRRIGLSKVDIVFDSPASAFIRVHDIGIYCWMCRRSGNLWGRGKVLLIHAISVPIVPNLKRPLDGFFYHGEQFQHSRSPRCRCAPLMSVSSRHQSSLNQFTGRPFPSVATHDVPKRPLDSFTMVSNSNISRAVGPGAPTWCIIIRVRALVLFVRSGVSLPQTSVAATASIRKFPLY